MRQHVLVLWIVVSTTVLLGLTVATLQQGGLLSLAAAQSLSQDFIGALSKPGCRFGITNDVNNCGVLAYFTCAPIGTDQPAPGNNQQCELCRLGTIQVQAQQKHMKRWRDCNGDGVADCEFWVAWPVPKCVQTVTQTACVECPESEDLHS